MKGLLIGMALMTQAYAAKTFPSKTITQSIGVPPKTVYEFVANPENLPQWAAGLSKGIKKVGHDWVADSPMGQVKVKFVPSNEFGVLDHDVTLPSGETVTNPMRVLKNGEGSEVMFTLFKDEKTDDKTFAHDAELVAKDLRSLKQVLERGRK